MATATIADGVTQRAERKLKELLDNNNVKLSNYSTKHVYDPTPKSREKLQSSTTIRRDQTMSVAEYACRKLREQYDNK
jgi:DNA-directed RNA polymerase subunit L